MSTVAAESAATSGKGETKSLGRKSAELFTSLTGKLTVCIFHQPILFPWRMLYTRCFGSSQYSLNSDFNDWPFMDSGTVSLNIRFIHYVQFLIFEIEKSRDRMLIATAQSLSIIWFISFRLFIWSDNQYITRSGSGYITRNGTNDQSFNSA